jgi:hypothetical protein
MKKIFFAAAAFMLTCSAFANTIKDVNAKVLDAFNKTFQNARQVVWHEYKDYYEVRFMQGTIDARVKYDTNGKIMEAVRYYKEDNLPLLIKAKIENKYAHEKIFGVTEVSSDAGVNYYVVLENEKNWINIKCDYLGNVSVQNKFKKA